MMTDEIKQDGISICEDKDVAAYEELWDSNPRLYESSQEIEDNIIKEMQRFKLLGGRTLDKYGNPNQPFVHVYQTKPQVEFEDPTMIRLVWYNIAIASVKHQGERNVSLTSALPLRELYDADFHLELFRTFPDSIKVVKNVAELGDMTGYDIWNEAHHEGPSFMDSQGSDYLGFFIKDDVLLQNIPKEAILYITREVEVKHNLDHDKKEVEEIVNILTHHATLLSDIEIEKQKLQTRLQSLTKQQQLLKTMYPSPNSLQEWQQQFHKLSHIEIEKQKFKIAKVVEEADEGLQKELVQLDEELDKERQAFLVSLQHRRAGDIQSRTRVRDASVKLKTKPFENEIKRLEDGLPAIGVVVVE